MAFGDVVQSNSGTGTTATVAPTLPGATTAGNIVVLTFAADDYNGTPNAGWTQSTGMEQQTFHGGYVWWLTATAAMTIPSYTVGSAVRSTWTLVEYAGPFDASPYDISSGQFQQTSTNTYTTPAITPTSGSRLLVAALNAQASTNDLAAWGSFTNSFTEAKASLFNGANPRLSITQLRLVVTANGSTAYSTGGTHAVDSGSLSRSGLIIAFKASAGGGGGFIGTLATTLGAATTAATGTVLVKGTSAVTAAAATLAGTAKVQVSGTLNVTLGAATGSLAGKVTVGGVVTTVLAPAVVVATGTVANSGTLGNLTATLGNATLAGVGAVTTPARTGTLNVTLQDATLYAASLPQIVATLNVSLDQATLLARGHVPTSWTRQGFATTRWLSGSDLVLRVTEVDRRYRITEGSTPLVRVLEHVTVPLWNRQSSSSTGWTKQL